MVDWATPDDVKDLTDVVVTVAEIKRAQAIVELFANVTTDASDQAFISTYNLRQLKRATAYQTVWMQDRPDIFSHVDTNGVSQDGTSGQHSRANAALLAPLADRCIARLSWKLAPLRIRHRRPQIMPQPEFGSLDSAAADDDRAWTPYP